MVVSNFLKKFEIATTFLFMAVHLWIFDILFVEMQGPRGTQKISVKIWGSWESQPSLPDTFYALDLLYDMPQWNFLMPLNQVELLHKMTLVNIVPHVIPHQKMHCMVSRNFLGGSKASPAACVWSKNGPKIFLLRFWRNFAW